MANRKNYKKRKKTGAKRTKQKRASNIDLAVVVLIILSLLFGVLIYTKSGVVGLKLSEILGGMMGIVRYILPVGIFAVAIKLASIETDELSSKIAQYVIFLISIAVLMGTVQIAGGELISTRDLSEVVKDAYQIGATRGTGGGAIGAALAVPLVKLLGTVGAVVLCLGVAILFLVFVFGISMSDLINNWLERAEEKREEHFQEREVQKEERLKNRQMMQEEKRKAYEQRQILLATKKNESRF